MKSLVACAVLFLVSCTEGPTPADVAGIYELFSENGEVVDRGNPPDVTYTFELKRNGAFVTTVVMGAGADTSWSSPFTVRAGEGGCVQVVMGRGQPPGDTLITMVCGDTWTWTWLQREREAVYKKRE